jgi:pimeloyl-ACP methyl ester carboxylesterase
VTRQKSFKRLVRARMEKTGESYSAARATLLAAEAPKTPDAPALTMSDEAIRRATGRGWEEWFDLLDEWGAEQRTHKEIARWIGDEQSIDGWWAQSVTVSYERARGMREVGERPGGFSVTAQKTVAVPVERLFDAFADEPARSRWLPGAELRERTATRPKSARFDWGDGSTRVVVGFHDKGEKSTVALEHERLSDAGEAERMKSFWRERLDVLAGQLEGVVTSRDGTRIAFERAGEGPALVLVDGALCFRRFGPMGPLAELLAPHFTVYRYDRRGRGDSGDTQPYAVARETEDLAAVIEAAGGSAFVFGMSSGAVLALEAAASGLPITKLALYEPPLSVDAAEPSDFGATLERLVGEGRRGDAVEFFLTSAGVPAEAVAGMRGDPTWALFESVAPTLVYDSRVLGDGTVPRDRAAKLTMPALVAGGAESPDFFRLAAEATADAIPGARHRLLAGQSWGQVDPAALAPVLREFFG